MRKSAKHSQQNSRLIIEELEPRRLFSGGIEGIVETGTDYGIYPIYRDLDDHGSQSGSVSDAAVETEQRSQEIIFVDSAVENYQQLVNDLQANTAVDRDLEVVMLDRDRDGIEQILMRFILSPTAVTAASSLAKPG